MKKTEIIIGDLPTTRLRHALGCPFDDQDPQTIPWLLGVLQTIKLLEHMLESRR
jgi:hypothetical protein